MIIHKTHSKKELINIIKGYNIKINNPQALNKLELCALLVAQLKQMENLKIDPDLPFLSLIDLKMYLIKQNPKKTLSIKDKSKVIMICRRIKHFSRNGYDIKNTEFYNTLDDLYVDAQYISHYGDIPSVRMALNELNNYPNAPFDIKVIISPHTQKEIDLKKRLKNKNKYRCEFKHGHFVVSFD